MSMCSEPFYCDDPECENPAHDGENWCGPCGGWIDGHPCDDPDGDGR